MTGEVSFDEKVRLEHFRSGIDAVREVGILALKTIITLNSGAFVVLLTFIGNAAAQSKFMVPLDKLQCSMYAFLCGIALSFIAIAYTYFVSQSLSPYPLPEKRTDGWFVPIVILITGLAVAAFLVGVITVIHNVMVVENVVVME
ncbi:hypothetical protein [Roseinatronobacter sp. S2]|uniref:hypothetical protein n=1 Tax=Roseinatronobacter sp. S2 TaxID=3035471 RepID=UPI00240F737E|nr:hypothetical protein [Roseinatronobacter sp. S2]WFE73343.1 hypothetical protein P8S53_09085 [Roseinatronobacter sp. S2]